MANEIKCPNCGEHIDVENLLSAKLEQQYKEQFQQELNKRVNVLDLEKKKLESAMLDFEEKKRNENELFVERMKKEKQKIEHEVQEQLQKTIAQDFENKIKILQQQSDSAEIKLREAREKELSFLQKEKALQEKEAEMEISIQRKIQAETEVLSNKIRAQEDAKNTLKLQDEQLKNKELELQLEQQRKLVEEMRRKAEQSSMQRQGEVQELLLEDILRENFPFDVIEEVGKGVEGADCIQIIRNSAGKECGKIIYESKRTKAWSNNWIDKLKSDMRSRNADIAIIVSQVFPKDMEKFGERDGIWICSFAEVSSVSHLVRQGIMKVYEAQQREENKGDKMQMLYNYLTGLEFKGQVEAIVEGFVAMRNSITKERIQMERIWKEREKQLEKVLLNTSGLYGSVKGIAGASVGDIPLLDGTQENLIENE